MDRDPYLASLEKMWRQEVEAAATYRLLSGREPDPRRKDILLRLAVAEEEHARRWAERIEPRTGQPPDPASVKQSLTWLQKIGDMSVILHRLEQEENLVEDEYARLMSGSNDPRDKAVAEEVAREEREHARTLHALAGPPPTPGKMLDSILRRERWHVRGTGWIGDAIYGVVVDRGRRLHPDHPVLFHRWHAGGDRVVHRQHAGALRGRCVEGTGHDAPLVGDRPGR